METAPRRARHHARGDLPGIAGVDRDDEAKTVGAIMRRIGQKSRVLVVNEALIALVAGARDAPGVVIIAGTGSIVYGRNAGGEAARAGGWGHIIGDEGSGYWIGREALAAVMRAADGRGPQTQLTRNILTHFDVADISRLPRIVYDRELGAVRGKEIALVLPVSALTAMPVATRSGAGGGRARSVRARWHDAPEMRSDAFTFYLAGGVPGRALRPTSCRAGSSKWHRGASADSQRRAGGCGSVSRQRPGRGRGAEYKPVMANGSCFVNQDSNSRLSHSCRVARALARDISLTLSR
jgi:hypothetical protein